MNNCLLKSLISAKSSLVSNVNSKNGWFALSTIVPVTVKLALFVVNDVPVWLNVSGLKISVPLLKVVLALIRWYLY